MPRRLRTASGGLAYHVLNRAVGRTTIFRAARDYEAFERAIADVHHRVPTRLLGYVLMPNHFHLVTWPTADGELSEFMRLLTVTHVQRWHAAHDSAGTGPIYQGRFKSFPIEQDEHLLTVLRYGDRNPLRAGLVERAEQWRWGSLWHHHHVGGDGDRGGAWPPWLLPAHEWPVPRRRDWVAWVNRPQTAAEEDAVRQCILRGRPFGGERWTQRTADRLNLGNTLRPRGRPKKKSRR